MFGADPRPTAWFNLGPVRKVSSQLVHILVVDVLDVFDTEITNPPAGREAASGTASGTASGPTSLGSITPCWSKWCSCHYFNNPPLRKAPRKADHQLPRSLDHRRPYPVPNRMAAPDPRFRQPLTGTVHRSG